MTPPHTLPHPMEQHRAALEQDPTNVDAASSLRLLLAESDGRLHPAMMRELRTWLEVMIGPWPRPFVVGDAASAPRIPDAVQEELLVHPREREGRQHQYASVFGRVLHLLEGDDLSRSVLSVTEEAVGPEYAPLRREVERCAHTLGTPAVPIHIARGRQAVARCLVDADHYLLLHLSLIDPSGTPLSELERRFLVARLLRHQKSGHAPLLQITPERLEGLVLDQVPLLVRAPLKLATRAVGRTGMNEWARRAADRLPDQSRSKSWMQTVGELLPDKEQETLLPGQVHTWVRGWIRGVELTADRAGLLLCGDLPSAVTTLIRLSTGSPATPTPLQRSLAETKENVPELVDRLRELMRFAISLPYLERRLGDLGVMEEEAI